MNITKRYRTETGHRLDNYDGKCSHYHGHSYLWEITVYCEDLDNRGMVIDFSELKAAIKTVLEPLDHCMLLHEDDPGVEYMKTATATNDKPQRLILLDRNPTAENMAKIFGAWIDRLLPEHVEVCSVRLWETADSYAEATWFEHDLLEAVTFERSS